MSIKSIAPIARKILPAFVFKYLRTIGTAILTPFLTSYRTGHCISSLKNKALDKHNNPIPWYTYPTIEFLSNKDFKDKRILEWGAGQSTLWWAQRAKEVLSFESNHSWYNHIKKHLPHNCSLFFTTDEIKDTNKDLGNKLKFDLIIIDGLNRYKCAVQSIELLSNNGAIILDNSDVGWGQTESDFPIIKLFQKNQFNRIDFYGNAPGVI